MERRVFKESLLSYYKIAYAASVILCVVFVWKKWIIAAVPLVVVLLLITDKLIRGEYVVEQQVITLQRGRFVKKRHVLTDDILSVRRVRGAEAWRGNVVLTCKSGVFHLNPEHPDSFVAHLASRLPGIQVIDA